MRVLVVDDNPDAADSLAAILDLGGYEVRSAYDGESALAVAREFAPDAAILDLLLPDISGYELARRLKIEPGCQNAYLIAYTGDVTETARQRSAKAGIDTFVLKPIDPSALTDLLREVDLRPRSRENVAPRLHQDHSGVRSS